MISQHSLTLYFIDMYNSFHQDTSILFFPLNKATSSISPFYFIYFSNILFTLSGSLAVASHLLLAGFWRGTHSPPWSKDTTDCTELSGTTRQNFYSCRNFVGTPVWKYHAGEKTSICFCPQQYLVRFILYARFRWCSVTGNTSNTEQLFKYLYNTISLV